MKKMNEELQENNNNIINENINDNSINEDNSLLLGIGKLNENKNENIVDYSTSINNIRANNTNNINVESHEKLNIRKKNGCLSSKTHLNIGNNLVFLNKYVFGPTSTLGALISLIVAISSTWGIWIYFIGDFYPKGVYFILFILFVLALFFIPISYLVEPGIIPRNCPDFIKEIENKDKNEEESIETTPRIFTERKCPTCNIIRPPGASHCSLCDICLKL